MSEWCDHLRVLVEHRNLTQTKPFVALVASHSFLSKQNSELQGEIEKLSNRIVILDNATEGGSGDAAVQGLKDQLHEAQRDLTAKYKAEASAATQALQLTSQNKDLEEDCGRLETRAETAERATEALKDSTRILEEHTAQHKSDLDLVKADLARTRQLLVASEKECMDLTISNRQLVQR
jgi:chromosome segregation ATPase